ERQHYDDVAEPGPDYRDRDDGEQDRRHRQEDVDDPHQYDLDRTAQIGRQHADDDAGRTRQDHGREGDEQRDPRPVDQAAEEIAAELVAAEPISDAARHEAGRPHAGQQV